MFERVVAHQFYRVVNPDSVYFGRVCQLVGAVTRDDDKDIVPGRIVRFADGSEGYFLKEELEAFDDV